jgi:VanZ family protein
MHQGPPPRLRAGSKLVLLPLRHSKLWLIVGWVLIVLAVIASIVPVQSLPQPPGLDDKMEHAIGYAVLALWFAGIYPRSRYPVIGVGLFIMGVAIEWAQGAMHLGRQADLRDVVANCIGVAVGLTLASLWLGGWAQRIEARVDAWTSKS